MRQQIKSVQQPEYECNQPWLPDCNSHTALTSMNDLHRYKDDREGDCGLDGSRRNMNESSVAAARVMLWATVKAVIALTRSRKLAVGE